MRRMESLTRLCSISTALATAFSLANAQSVERISIGLGGADANGASSWPSLSADGRYVCFESSATNLIANDTNGAVNDVFVRDRVAQTTVLVSVDNAGQQSSSISLLADTAMSGDGRYVAFGSSSLDPSDTDAELDIYVRDRVNGTTTFVTATTNGNSFDYFSCKISDDGRVAAYGGDSYWFNASNMTARDLQSGASWFWSGYSVPLHFSYYGDARVSSDGRWVIYFHRIAVPGYSQSEFWRLDTTTGVQQVLASHDSASMFATSSDGRYLLYSEANQLLRLDIQTMSDERIVTATSITGGSLADVPRYVVFASSDDTLVPADTNACADVFLRDVFAHTTLRVSSNASGQEANQASIQPAISRDASVVAFASAASNLVTGDVNGVQDVFVRTNCFVHYLDADGDGFGAPGGGVLACAPVAAGLVPNALDCDDSNPSVHPSAPEVCNGADNDCDGHIDFAGDAYCTTSTTTQGCTPHIDVSGCPQASASSGFVVSVHAVDGQRTGMLFYGLQPLAQPWAPSSTSTLCVASPRQRTTSMSTGGTSSACDGALALDLLAWAAAHPSALALPLSGGEQLYIQGWFRDPLAPKGTNLSDAWSVTIQP